MAYPDYEFTPPSSSLSIPFSHWKRSRLLKNSNNIQYEVVKYNKTKTNSLELNETEWKYKKQKPIHSHTQGPIETL